MFWIIVSILLLIAVAALVGWRFYLDRQWQRELRYFNRHENAPPPESGGEAKAVYGAKPNLNNSRHNRRDADESRAVYERTVEKLREVAPKRYRKLNAADAEGSPQTEHFHDLPIFAASQPQKAEEAEAAENPPVEENVQTASQAETPETVQTPEAESEAEQEAALQPETPAEAVPVHSAAADDAAEAETDIENAESESEPDAEVRKTAPPPDAEVITADEIGHFKRKSVQEIMAEEFEYTHRGDPADEAAEMEGPPSKPAADAEVITEAEVGRFRREPAAALIEKFSPEVQEHVPPPDAEIITLADATRNLAAGRRAHEIKPRPGRYEEQRFGGRPPHTPAAGLPVISYSDPSVLRVEERAAQRRLERKKQNFNAPAAKPAVQEAVRPSEKGFNAPETIEESDIRANLMMRRMARQRQSARRSDIAPRIIPADEVISNLARTERPSRRLRRISTVDNASILPASARISNYGGEVVKPKPAAKPLRADSALANRFAPYPYSKPAEVPPPDATVVEPPAVPPTPPLSVDVPPPASVAFSAEMIQPWDEGGAAEYAFAGEEAAGGIYSDAADAQEWLDDVFAPSEQEQPEYGGYADRPSEHDEPSENSDLVYGNEAVFSESAPFSDGLYPLPGLNLLKPASYNPDAAQSEEALLENSITIEEKLAEFKVKVKVLEAYAGPVITRYEIEPDVGVRGNAVLNLEKDLARSLGVASIRVVETIPGKTCMGLELPNPKRQMIRLSEIFDSPAFAESPSKLTLALGQDITGQPVVTDLARAPHLLVAGTTGSGKSVGVNAMILSMLFKATPDDVRMIMIDPKMLELSIYEGIPHLLAPVVTDMRLAANALTWCVNEMDKRYRLMSHLGVRNLAGYNQKIREEAAYGRKIGNPFSLTPDNPEPLEKLPFIVVVVDEFADLMMTAGKKIEELIARITQKARAAGIHLILATQRPSVDVITGLIKANIPTRIAFQVSSKIDSRTILDQMGAENLLGQGDMLFLPPGTGYPQRVHGAFASDEEVHGVVEYLKQFGEPDYVEDLLTGGVGSDDIFSNANEGRNNEGGSDPLYDEAVSCVIKTNKATISSVQRYLKIGYNRAANLIEQMEADGIISAADAGGKRTVLARDSSHLDG